MTDIAYKYYRIVCDKVRRPDYYVAASEFRLFENRGGENLALNSIATASLSLDSSTFKITHVNDGKTSTYWASVQMIGDNKVVWLQLELPEPKVVRAFDLISTNNKDEVPVDYTFQASNNGTDWFVLHREQGNAIDDIYVDLSLKKVSGMSLLSNGAATNRVLITDWVTGELISTSTPAVDGFFLGYTLGKTEVMVTHIGPENTEPKSDGPITVY